MNDRPMVALNPGTEPRDEATLKHAEANLKQFLAEAFPCPRLIRQERLPDLDGEGRFGFRLSWSSHPELPLFEGAHDLEAELEMPGLPLAQVHCEAHDNPWGFPRLYLNGSSWLWSLAVGQIRQTKPPTPEGQARRKAYQAWQAQQLQGAPPLPQVGETLYFGGSPPYWIKRRRVRVFRAGPSTYDLSAANYAEAVAWVRAQGGLI